MSAINKFSCSTLSWFTFTSKIYIPAIVVDVFVLLSVVRRCSCTHSITTGLWWVSQSHYTSSVVEHNVSLWASGWTSCIKGKVRIHCILRFCFYIRFRVFLLFDSIQFNWSLTNIVISFSYTLYSFSTCFSKDFFRFFDSIVKLHSFFII